MEIFLLKLILLDSGCMQTCAPVWKRVKSCSVIQRNDCFIIQKLKGKKSPLLLFMVPRGERSVPSVMGSTAQEQDLMFT